MDQVQRKPEYFLHILYQLRKFLFFGLLTCAMHLASTHTIHRSNEKHYHEEEDIHNGYDAKILDNNDFWDNLFFNVKLAKDKPKDRNIRKDDSRYESLNKKQSYSDDNVQSKETLNNKEDTYDFMQILYGQRDCQVCKDQLIDFKDGNLYGTKVLHNSSEDHHVHDDHGSTFKHKINATSIGHQHILDDYSGWYSSKAVSKHGPRNGYKQANFGYIPRHNGVIFCGALDTPSNGSQTGSGNTVGDIIVFTCDTGYSLSGSSIRVCQSDGTWSGTAATCTIVDCGTLATPTNGFQTGTGTTYLSVITFGCNTGYTLTGSATRTCQANGVWSGTTAVCTIVNCGALTTPTNGAISSTTGNTYLGVINFECDCGFVLSGSASRTCQADGTWSGTTTVCTAVDAGTCLIAGSPCDCPLECCSGDCFVDTCQ